MREIVFPAILFLIQSLFLGMAIGYTMGLKDGNVEVVSGKVVCQQALGKWVCKHKQG